MRGATVGPAPPSTPSTECNLQPLGSAVSQRVVALPF